MLVTVIAQPTTLILYHNNHKIVSGIFTLHTAVNSLFTLVFLHLPIDLRHLSPESCSAGGEYPFPLFSPRRLLTGCFIKAAYRLPDTENSLQMELYSVVKVQLTSCFFAVRPVCALRYYAYLLTSHVSPKPKLKKAKISMEFRLSSLIGILSYRIYEIKSIGAGIVHI